jgi:hypothetical protein
MTPARRFPRFVTVQSARLTIEDAQDSIVTAALDGAAVAAAGQRTGWVELLGRNSIVSGDRNAYGYEDDLRGFALGAGVVLDSGVHVGIAGSYGSSEVIGAADSRADVDVKSLYAHAGWGFPGPWSATVSIGATEYDVNTMRALTLADATTRTTGSGSGRALLAAADVRYAQPVFGASRLDLVGGLHAQRIEAHEIAEHVAGADGRLTMRSDRWQQAQASFGAKYVIGRGTIRGSLHGELQYELRDTGSVDRRTVSNQSGAVWIVASPTAGRVQSTVGAGLEADLGGTMGLRLDFTGSRRGDGFSDREARLRVFMKL